VRLMNIFYFFVMAGIVPAIHVFVRYTRRHGIVEPTGQKVHGDPHIALSQGRGWPGQARP
jgi:hypothetical protein